MGDASTELSEMDRTTGFEARISESFERLSHRESSRKDTFSESRGRVERMKSFIEVFTQSFVKEG